MKRITTNKKLPLVSEQLRVLTIQLATVGGGRPPPCSADDSGCSSKPTTG